MGESRGTPEYPRLSCAPAARGKASQRAGNVFRLRPVSRSCDETGRGWLIFPRAAIPMRRLEHATMENVLPKAAQRRTGVCGAAFLANLKHASSRYAAFTPEMYF